MIIVYFSYFSLTFGEWLLGTNEFTDAEKARRFIIYIRKNVNFHFIRYVCDDPEDNEYIWSRI